MMRAWRGSVAFAFASAFALVLRASSVAHAQDADPKARADALFREGERLFTAGEIASACKAYADSQRLDPALGTLINLALCHERQGRTATAMLELKSALAQATSRGQAERMKLLADEIAKLEPRLSRLVLTLPEGSTPDITFDGARLDSASFGAPFPVDPGTHTLVASAPKKRTATVTLNVAEGPATQAVVVPALEDEAIAPAPSESVPTEARGNGRRVLGFTFLGVAVAGVGVGSVLGLLAKSDQDTADELCEPGVRACTSREGVDASSSAQSKATIATIGFGVGLAAGIAGAYLVITAPKSATSTQRAPLRIGARGAGVVLEGAW